VSPGVVVGIFASSLPLVAVEFVATSRESRLVAGLTRSDRRRFFYTRLQTEVNSVKEIKFYNLGERLRERMLGELSASNDSHNYLERAKLTAELVAAALGTALLLLSVVHAVNALRGRPDAAAAFTTLLVASLGIQIGVLTMFRALFHCQLALTPFRRYLSVIDTVSTSAGPAARVVAPLSSSLELKDVWFRHSSEAPWVLRGLSFSIPCGASTGIVGPNGAGKSTVVKLLTGMHKPTKGAVLWDGIDIRTFAMADYRKHLGVVFQDFMRYDLSIRDNVDGLGSLALSNSEVAAVLARVEFTVDDSRFPQGIDTVLGSGTTAAMTKATTLSGGEWQKLAIARALARPALDVAIFDEPTASMDPQSEATFGRLVRSKGQAKTTVSVSHRLGALVEFDRIVVLEEGRLAEEGSHSDLLALNGPYASSFAVQAGSYLDRGAFGKPGP